MSNWWPFGRYTRFLERTLAESRSDFLERLRDKDDQIREYRVLIGSLEAKIARREGSLVPVSKYVTYPGRFGGEEPRPEFGKTEVDEEYGDWQSQLERAIAGVNHEAPKEEASNEASST